MDDLTNFNFEGNQVRTVIVDDEPMFVANDVANALGYVNGNRDVNRHVEEEDRQNYRNGTLGGNRGMTVITESGVYSLIFGSKLPSAKRFKHWVTSMVLPAIREQGMYMEPAKVEQLLSNPDTMIEILTRYKESQAEVQQLNEEKRLMQPKVDYFDDLVERNLLTNFRDTAKELHIGQKAFINWLLEHKYVYRNNGRNKQLKHYAKYDHDLFEYRESVSEWTDKTFIQTLITPKGRETFKLLLEQQAS
ncbi:BRO family protein [Furfurilactobacillus siliginis]|uniref:Phage antirepressor protein n=1 Tax=Furfurilactobacillus siliginis TaxID=348151 RepID=A0A0R2LAA6_9LACO|nr:BRO family protein [Furfurilactobacillus siliginis]KRN96725.1 phage antirepressor protein [Furfurilactobacillus siliginis]GEK28874.1 putative antirepressor - phage associated [Furfurilactobacillus siliginis]